MSTARPRLLERVLSRERTLAELRRKVGGIFRDFKSPLFRRSLFYFVIPALSLALITELVEASLDFSDMRASITELQTEQAVTAAERIDHYIDGIEKQLGWTVQLPWIASTMEERRFDAFRLIRRVPEISQLIEIDPSGREGLRVSPSKVDVVGSGEDNSANPLVARAKKVGVAYGAAQFPSNSEPFMDLAVSGARPEAGVSIATINLTMVRQIIARIKVRGGGRAYVVDTYGRLISHPDGQLVLKRVSFSDLPQVSQAITPHSADTGGAPGRGPEGSHVLAAYSKIPHLGWIVFVESPEREAFAVVYDASLRALAIFSIGVLLLALAGVAMTRRITRPIQVLRAGVTGFGSGDMSRRIHLHTNDELEELASQFNEMAQKLSDLYGGLERTVLERTLELRLANEAKSRFLAIATHDLRQPLHALQLFVSELRHGADADLKGGTYTVGRIEAALRELTELFDSLLDISRLDAGVVGVQPRSVELAEVLSRVERRYAPAAWEKGLHFRFVATSARVRTDPILFERIIMNLVANAIKYTQSGGIVVGCRRRPKSVVVEVLDSGSGIPEHEIRNVFKEFYQISNDNSAGGLGLGLAIVDRLCSMLGHELEVRSKLGTGTCFMITVPTSAQTSTAMELSPEPEQARRGFTGRILLVENDALALEATTAALRGMGFTVESIGANQAFDLPRNQGWPDLIISDYHCSEGRNGVELVEALRTACGKKVPAIIVTGDTRSETLHHVRDAGLMLLHKPLNRDQLNAAIADALDAQPCRNSLETITTASVLLEAPSSLRTTVT